MKPKMNLNGVFKEQSKVAPDFYLQLLDDGHYIDLVAVDSTGSLLGSGYLVTIDKATLEATLHGRVSQQLGFNLDKHGRLKFKHLK